MRENEWIEKDEPSGNTAAPLLNITDDSGRVISGERHLKAGSALRLRCEGRDVLERLNESLLWTRGDETLTSNVNENRTTELVDDKEISVIVSTLTVERATPRHAGNYSCTVPERAKTTIAVHVLNVDAITHSCDASAASQLEYRFRYYPSACNNSVLIPAQSPRNVSVHCLQLVCVSSVTSSYDV
ncbi:hypothetical protein PV326_014091 [Microctonus aethiopoides]|nr:hypothetical protein PV326_014091 [Microctonus aethiopoides]